MIKTICDHCYFAETKDGEQIGCSLGRIEKYVQLGKAQKKDNGFYEIDKLCPCCRTHDAVKKYEDPKKEILKQCEPKITVIINCVNFDETYYDYIEELIEERPHEIIMYFHKSKISQVNKDMAKLVNGTGVKYRLVNFINEEPSHVNVIKYINGNYVFVGVPSGNISSLKEEVTNNLKEYLLYGSPESFVVSSLLYKHISQNFETIKSYILEKENGENFLCEK